MNNSSSVFVMVAIADISINHISREVNPAKAQQLAESIEQSGLFHPITLSSDYYLLAGAHRLEAHRILGREVIECRIVSFAHDSSEAEIFTLDENLMRQELTPLEEGEYLVRRDEILQEMGLRAERGKSGTKSETVSSLARLRTTAEIAAETGLGKRSAQHRMQIVRNLTLEQRDLIRHTPLAHQVRNLLSIARIQDPDRKNKVIRLMISDDSPPTVKVAVRRVRIESGEIPDTLDIIKPSNWWAFGRPKYRKEDGFPGSIPGEVYANALYYFAPRQGVAVDAMAGSGMLRRVYDDRDRWQPTRPL